tara:strand:- start:95 stop:502 length:408 start_codon:yes stop_codon:yes gene_type:complete
VQYIQGRIKKAVTITESGVTRLLLERKNGSEFVAIVPSQGDYGIGTNYKSGGFEPRDPVNGRDVYELVDVSKANTHVDLNAAPEGEPEPSTELREASVELAAIINLTSLLMQQPIRTVIQEINETYGIIRETRKN